MYSAILLNGGIGKRFGAPSPKQFVKVNGVPILVYPLVAMDATEQIGQIVINYPPGWRDAVEQIIADYAIKTPVEFVEAGASRHESVAKMVPHCQYDDVIVHEAARPMVATEDFETLVAAPGHNVAYVLPIPFTVAPIDVAAQKFAGYLERDTLRNVQLPQKFRRTDLAEAHDYAKREGVEFTEDATLVAAAGFDVATLTGKEKNIKVTGPLDVHVASYLLRDEEDVDG